MGDGVTGRVTPWMSPLKRCAATLWRQGDGVTGRELALYVCACAPAGAGARAAYYSHVPVTCHRVEKETAAEAFRGDRYGDTQGVTPSPYARHPAPHRVPQRDSTGSMPSGGPVVAPPPCPEGCHDLVAVRLSDGSLRAYRGRPGCVTREEVETACLCVAWRDRLGRWHAVDVRVELTTAETTWLNWSLSVKGMRVASPSPPRPIASPGRVAVDVVGWCQLAEGVRRWLRAWGFAREPGLVVLGGEGLEAGDRLRIAEQLGSAGLCERAGVWEA